LLTVSQREKTGSRAFGGQCLKDLVLVFSFKEMFAVLHRLILIFGFHDTEVRATDPCVPSQVRFIDRRWARPPPSRTYAQRRELAGASALGQFDCADIAGE
jgi:hypothetical protein